MHLRFVHKITSSVTSRGMMYRIVELHTYLCLLLSFSIFLHPHHYVLQGLPLGVGALIFIFLELSCLSVSALSLGAHIL